MDLTKIKDVTPLIQPKPVFLSQWYHSTGGTLGGD